jgi:hypothetical protein
VKDQGLNINIVRVNMRVYRTRLLFIFFLDLYLCTGLIVLLGVKKMEFFTIGQLAKKAKLKYLVRVVRCARRRLRWLSEIPVNLVKFQFLI